MMQTVFSLRTTLQETGAQLTNHRRERSSEPWLNCHYGSRNQWSWFWSAAGSFRRHHRGLGPRCIHIYHAGLLHSFLPSILPPGWIMDLKYPRFHLDGRPQVQSISVESPLSTMPNSNPNADEALAAMGYKSELPRKLSMLSVLGLSFAIMAAPYGLSTTLYITLDDGLSVTIIWGWVFVTLISIPIAASLAEICAVYPTAGGVYYWSAMLSTRRWAPLMSFIDGWLTLVGNWTVTLSIIFGGGQMILSAISLWNEDFVANEWQTVLMFWAVLLVCALVNVFCSSYLDL